MNDDRREFLFAFGSLFALVALVGILVTVWGG